MNNAVVVTLLAAGLGGYWAVHHPDIVATYVPAPVLDQAAKILPAEWLPRTDRRPRGEAPRQRDRGRRWDDFRGQGWGPPDYGPRDDGRDYQSPPSYGPPPGYWSGEQRRAQYDGSGR